METIIGRLQTEADERGRRTDIQLETTVSAVKLADGSNMSSVINNMDISATISNTQPSHSSLWFIPD